MRIIARSGLVRAPLVAALFLAAVGGATAIPPAPVNCRALPDYGDGSILVEWDDLEAETGYRVYRSVAAEGPFAQIGDDLPPDTLSLIDLAPDPALEHFYMVRAFDDFGESPDSNVFQQNVKIIWPNPGNHALLHNWNETIGNAAAYGFHRGCDIQQVGLTPNMIHFPRGGIVARVGNQGRDNNHIYVEVRIGADLRYDSFNHLTGKKVTDLGYDVGDYVRAGQEIVPIGDEYFVFHTVDFVDHTHYFIPSHPITNETDGQHPLKIFAAADERDPGNLRPSHHDHGLLSDGTVLYHRQGAIPGPPYLELPLGDDPATPDEDEADVDLHVEIADLMGFGATQVPTSVAWWISGPDCAGDPPSVRSAAAPYVLLRWGDRSFRQEPVEWQHLVDAAQDLAPLISYEGVDYPATWNNFKHFILTNTAGDDGAPLSVDETQYWNTNAMQDGSPPEVAHANFAGLEDATRAADARFPDGSYTLHVVTTDLLGSTEDSIPGVELENFPPAVITRGFEPGGSFHCKFSEPMDTAAVDSAIEFNQIGTGPLGHSVSWSPDGCELTLTPDLPLEACPLYEVVIDATIAADPAGRLLDASYDSPFHDGQAGDSVGDSVRTVHSVEGVLEVSSLAVDATEHGTTEVSWTAGANASSYSLTRGDLAALASGQYGACLATGLAGLVYVDVEDPPPGAGFVYLVQGENASCGPGSLGRDTSGAERVNQDPGSCW